MSYLLQALVAEENALRDAFATHPVIKIVSLNQGLGLLPLTKEVLESFDESVTYQEKPPALLEETIIGLSMKKPVAYVVAEYSGGTGGQSALVWSNGQRALQVEFAQDAINQALRLLGVKVNKAFDEFEEAGLRRHRFVKDWVLESKGGPA